MFVVNDDRAILRTITRILQRAGFCAETAENGKEALEKIQTRSYYVALLDIVLGDSNGLDLLPSIDETSPNTVKIIITGADLAERRTEAYRNVADAYLTKPVNPETLLSFFERE